VKTIWLSANLLGYELLKEAISLNEVEIGAVITLSRDSKTKMYDGIGIDEWKKLGIPVFGISRADESIDLMTKLAPDLIVMCGWRQIVSKEFLGIPPLGVVGFHPTLLPQGRGPAPIINSILEGFTRSGVTMFYADEGLDSGDIVGQERFNIEEDDYAQDVYDKVIKSGKNLIRKYLPLILGNKTPKEKQDESKATIFKRRDMHDNEIKLSDPLEEIYRKIRAFSKPYLGAYVKEGKKKLIIWQAERQDDE